MALKTRSLPPVISLCRRSHRHYVIDTVPVHAAGSYTCGPRALSSSSSPCLLQAGTGHRFLGYIHGYRRPMDRMYPGSIGEAGVAGP
ncbi:hypothetical protein BS78_02G118500 [Paspalum vaginatum]|nr:hypothetical protein BS78_02G118500 [Paspalum vaginatum]